MATIDDRATVDRLIAGKGRIDPEDAPDNPWATKIVEYTTPEGRIAWGVVFEHERDQRRYEVATAFVWNPRVIWARNRW